jgi:hypothetical protein
VACSVGQPIKKNGWCLPKRFESRKGRKKIGAPRAHAKGVTRRLRRRKHHSRDTPKGAELHEFAAQAHRTAAEHNEKGDRTVADWHSERALAYADHAYKLAKEAHNKSGDSAYKCLLVITTDRITRIINELPSCTIAPPTRIVALRKLMRN